MKKNTYIVLAVVIILGIVFWVLSLPKDEKVTQTGGATVSTLSVSNVTSPASAVLAGAKTISWKTGNYPNDAGLNINLIRKVSDSPKEFTLVRTLATNTPNDGEETWVPQAGENSSDLYVEVTCSTTYQFTDKCSLTSDPVKVN